MLKVNRQFHAGGGLPAFCLWGVFSVAMAWLGGCENNDRPNGSQTPSETVKGITLTPRSFDSLDFVDFFEKAQQAGDIVSWAGDWAELSDTISGGPKVLAELAAVYNFIPLIEAQFFSSSTGQLLRPLDDATKSNYKNGAAAFAQHYQPEYLAFGIEINILYELSPADFETFVPFYAEVYDTVKAVSPSTKVFTIFQLEKMKGLNGGLFGGVNDTANAQWYLLNEFPQSDLMAFTTYPGLIYQTPQEVPANHYSEIALHTSKKAAFTEIGWHSAANPVGWESSEAEQAEFISAFFDLTANLEKEMLIWSFMYDQDTIEPFDSMGLYKTDGTAKPAWEEWLNAP